MNIKRFLTSYFVATIVLLLTAGLVLAGGHILSFTDFGGFTLGASVDGQGGWSAASKWDEDVADDAGNTVWRVSNAVTAGSFGDMPFAPRPGGIPTDTVNDPDNSSPESFAGESSTGADNREFFSEFDFKSATGTTQSGLRITVSADNGQGARQSFVAIEDTGTGLQVTTFDVDPNTGTFIGPIPIGDELSYTDWHKVGMDVEFIDGTKNDVVRYFVNEQLVHTNTSWEEFYRNFQAAQHPLDVPVQTLLFRLSGTAQPAVAGDGFFIDNVTTGIGLFSLDPTDKNQCKSGGWEEFGFRNQGQCIRFVNTGFDSR